MRSGDALGSWGRAEWEAHLQAEAEAPWSAEALQARRETLGDRHPDTLTSISNVGMLLQAQGDLEGAAALMRAALAGELAAHSAGSGDAA